MAWYLPGTWQWLPSFMREDLGAARRVSIYTYDNQKLNVDIEKSWVYSVSCKVLAPDGRLVEESYSEYTTSPWMLDDKRPLMMEIRRKLKDKIREKYPVK
ncbi:MAG: hypothetical protein HY517_02020 [Candidatus Aenigmarchaeota archaeon]|nr:hypothetical protein [Candidatus Aenigmarchaeota archaeon]